MSIYKYDNTIDKMSFNQFHTKIEPVSKKCGGWTAPRDVGPDELAVWAKVSSAPDTGAELAAKGTPTSVQTAVVSGLKFRFTFEDDSTVIVWRSWRNVISIVND